MKCWHCDSNVVWNSDFDFEDFGCEDEGVVSILVCSNEDCKAWYEVYLKNK